MPFKSLSFSLRPGEKVAMFGAEGSGKTTLADLLSGLRLPNQGRIEIDQLDLREISLEQLRRHVAVVGYSEIIEDTILENIRLGRPEVSITEVRKILKRLGLMVELEHIPEGIYTRLSLSGLPLSTTQVRQLMLARAIAGHPRLLIIDGLLDEWQSFGNSRAKEMLLSPEAPWTLLLLTASREVARHCQRTIEIAPAR